MKKLFLILFCIFCCSLSCFAEYKPIPKHLSKQYKAEMEQLIDDEYPIVIKNIDNLLIEAKILNNKLIKNGFNFQDAMDLTLISEVCIPAAALNLYAKLMKTTEEKYLGIKYIPIGTDSTSTFIEFLLPYFKDNNINTKKLSKITAYSHKKINIINKYIQQTKKLQYTNN